MSKKVIIFDFDGVIADSFHVALHVNQMSKPTLTEERYRQIFDGNIGDAVHTDKVIREIDFQEEYAKQFESLHIDGNIKENIKLLSKQFQLFVISSTITQTIQDYLQKHDLSDCFTEILGYDVEKSKVKKFEIVFKKYSIDPKEVIFISDTSGDIHEAKEARVEYIVGILGGYQSEASLKKAHPNIIVKNFQEFCDLVTTEEVSERSEEEIA